MEGKKKEQLLSKVEWPLSVEIYQVPDPICTKFGLNIFFQWIKLLDSEIKQPIRLEESYTLGPSAQ